MSAPTERSGASRFGALALFLLGTAFLLRLWVPGGAAGAGTNAFIHVLFLAGALVGLLSLLRRPVVEAHFSGAEIPLAIFVLLGAFSVTWASYKFPALQSALAYGAFALFSFAILNAFRTRPHLLFSLLFGFLFVLSLYCLLQKFVLLPEARAAGAADPRFQGSEMAARLASDEVFGTFLYPNSLAGFLVLVLPILAGSILDRKKGRIPEILLLLLGGTVLFLTGSKGGWVSLGVAAIFLAALAITRNRDRLRKLVWIGTGTGVLLVTGLVVAGPLAPGKLENASMRMRDIYWSAALRIAGDNPGLGVGLDNFQEYYPEYKGETQQETRKVHNDYLQILVEVGVPGLLAFLLLLGCVFRHAVRRPRDSLPLESTPREREWLIAVGVVSVFLAWMIEGAFGLLWTSVLAVCWSAFAWFRHPRQPQENREGTRLGCVAGLAGFMVHMSVDFDFYEFGLAASLFLVLALIPLLGGRTFVLEMGRMVSISFSALLAIVLIPLLLIVVPRLLESDRLGRSADLNAGEALSLEFAAASAKREGKLLRAEEARLASDGKFNRAMELYREARESNPFDADPHMEYAVLSLKLWERLRKMAGRDGKIVSRMAIAEAEVVNALEKALLARPRSIPAESLLAHAHFQFANHHRGNLAREKEHLDQARVHATRTMLLYPTRAQAHYEAGRIFYRCRETREAQASFATALHLSANAEKEGLDRLQLNPVQKARALFRLKRAKEARKLLRDWFEAELESSQRGSVAAKRIAIETFLGETGRGEKLKEIIGEEFDSFLGPMIVNVLETILRSLPNQ